MKPGSVLIVPACERGRGGGHLGRSVFLLWELYERGRDVYLWIPGQLKDDTLFRFREFFESFDGARTGRLLSSEEELSKRAWDFIVVDKWRTSKKEVAYWTGFGPLVGIDEGGPRRKYFDFLVDLLPALSGPEANTTSPGLLPLPRNRRSGVIRAETRPLRALISFGAEDAAGLGFSAARALAGAAPKKNAAGRAIPPPEITLIAPVPPRDDSGGGGKELPGVKIVGKFPALREHLAEYDLFITHFGVGAFEAVYTRLPVLLVSPTAYHEKLGRNAGFLSLGRGTNGARRLRKLDMGGDFLETLNGRGKEIARRYGLEEDQKEDAGSFINGLVPRAPRNCPACRGKAGGPVLARFPEESYRRCPVCGMIYLCRLNPPPIEYGKDYFFDFYKKQYGKTYLEDFPGLVEMGRKRLGRIRALVNRRVHEPSLLDIGCAYGPFLAAAAECGFSPAGIEPAEDAAGYVTEKLGFPVSRGFFPEAAEGISSGSFDAVTLWYVIEHFEEPGGVLGEIYRLLKDGGVLAFSTPSFSGVSGRKSLRSFLKNSPPDHWTVWSPRVCKKVLLKYGFRLRKIVVTGHHPERFPFFGRFAVPAQNGPLFRLLLFISRLFRLGDTFEAYAVKGEVR